MVVVLLRLFAVRRGRRVGGRPVKRLRFIHFKMGRQIAYCARRGMCTLIAPSPPQMRPGADMFLYAPEGP